MKCVCPMGGDRVCPDDCLLAAWADMSPADRKVKRQAIAQTLYKQGFTQEQIATQLGVTQRTISTDLEGLETTSKPPRPKGGRPKSDGPKRASKPRNQTVPAADRPKLAEAVLDQGKTVSATAADAGVSVQIVKTSIEREKGRREAEPLITPEMLSMSAQDKLDAAIRQHQRKLDLSFEKCVLAEAKKRIDEMVLPHWQRQIDEAKELYRHRRGAMDKATFNKIRRALHPDSRNSISDKVLAEAFDTFMSLEKFLLDEKDSPTEVGAGLPRTWDEWEKAKQAATAARRAKRGANSRVPMRQ